MTPNLRAPRPAPRRRAVLAAMLPALALLAACGGTTSGGTTSGGAASPGSSPSGTAPRSAEVATYPVTVTAANGAVTIAAQPKRIVSLSPTATEMLYAIGAGSQVVAVDDLSNYPAQAPKTSLSAFKPNVEAVVANNPDLVVVSNDTDGLVAALAKLKVPALYLPAAADLEASYVQGTILGKATGHPAAAAEVIGRTKSRIAAAVASVPASAKGLKIYHEVDQTYYSVTSKTFLGGVYRLLGLTNIADAAPDAASSGGYPKLSAEYVVSAAPDLIVLADSKCCGQSPQAVGRRPAFAAVPAVTHSRVIAIDDDIASRWGPRTADFAEAVAKALGGR